MLVHQPHDLRGIDGGAAADGDDDVGLELVHGGHALHGVLDLGVNADVVEGAGGNAHLLQLLDGAVAHAQLEEGGVGDDEGALAVVLVTELLQSDGGAALLEIDLLRQSQPQHILSPFRDSLDVQQLHDVGLAHEGAAAEGARPEGQGGRRIEVVEVAQAAEGGGHVDDDAAGLHAQAEGVDLLTLVGVDVHGGGVAGAALGDQLVADVHGLGEILGAVHAQDGAELLVGPGVVVGGIVGLGDEDLGVGGDLDAGHLGQLGGGAADGGGLDAVGGGVEEDLADLGGLFLGQEVAAALLELLLDLVIDAVQDGDMLLSGADHAVVEGLGVDGGSDGVVDVAGIVEDNVAVAGADADGGGTGGVRGLHHAGAAGGHDEVDFPHHHLGHLDGALVHPADDVLGQAGLLGGLPHDAGSLDGALLGGGMGGEQDRVAGLQADQNLENGGRGGVGGGGDGAHNAHRLGDALGAEGLILGDDAAGLHVAEVVVDMLGGIVVLDDLILDDAHAGLGVGHLGQGDTGLVGGHSGLLADLIDLLLGELAVDGLGFPHLCQLGFQRLEGSNFVELLCHRCLPNFDVISETFRGSLTR